MKYNLISSEAVSLIAWRIDMGAIEEKISWKSGDRLRGRTEILQGRAIRGRGGGRVDLTHAAPDLQYQHGSDKKAFQKSYP